MECVLLGKNSCGLGLKMRLQLLNDSCIVFVAGLLGVNNLNSRVYTCPPITVSNRDTFLMSGTLLALPYSSNHLR